MDVEKSVGAVITREKNDEIEFLIVKRSDKENYWEYPKGHQDKGETDLETLHRELEEEIGLKRPNIIKNFQHRISYKSSKGTKRVLLYFLVLINEDIQLSEEHSDYKWLRLEDVTSYFDYNDMKELTLDAFNRVKCIVHL